MTEHWKRFRFTEILSEPMLQTAYRTPILSGIFAIVANRCLAPASKLAVSDWVKKQVYIPDLPLIDVQILYRAMDFLLDHQADLEQEIYRNIADIFNLEVDILFFDTTSTYFESEQTNALKKRGYSKDKRKDLPQVVIGLAVTRDRIPVKHWVFPGNTADMETIEVSKRTYPTGV